MKIKTIYVVIAILVVLVILGYVLSQSGSTKKVKQTPVEARSIA